MSKIEEVARAMDREFMKAMTNAVPQPDAPPFTLEAMLDAIKKLPPAPPRIVRSWLLTRQREDWSRVRSPSRAERRRKRGHRQNIETVTYPDPNAYRIGNEIHVHPFTLDHALTQENGE